MHKACVQFLIHYCAQNGVDLLFLLCSFDLKVKEEILLVLNDSVKVLNGERHLIDTANAYRLQRATSISIYIPWPFPPVWGVADNTEETTKQ